MPNRVVITGFGAITPVGLTADETWNNIISGVSGIDNISAFDCTDFNVKVAGEVKNFDPLLYLDPNTTKYSDRFTQFAVSSSMQAIESAKLKINDSNKYDIGILIGSGIGGISSMEKQVTVLNNRGPNKVSPYIVPMMIADNASGRTSIKSGIQGMNVSLVSSCSTGTDSIGIAYTLLKYGEYKVFIAGGTDASITPIGIAGFSQAGALSRNTNPAIASRPFDANRDGFVMGEGSAILVLETLEHAMARKAKIIAEIVGYGCTSDAFHITQPSDNGEAGAKAITRALNGINIDELDYINAHGTSTPLNDLSETRVIKKVFGKMAYQIPLSSIKSMTGHMLGAAGALEVMICCKVVCEDIIPPTINYETPDPDCDLDYVPNKARTGRFRTVISNSFGFGGHNSVIAIRKYEEN